VPTVGEKKSSWCLKSGLRWVSPTFLKLSVHPKKNVGHMSSKHRRSQVMRMDCEGAEYELLRRIWYDLVAFSLSESYLDGPWDFADSWLVIGD